MRRKGLIFFMISLSIIFLPRYLLSVQRVVNLAILDTVGREAALFDSLTNCAREIGIAIDYIGLDSIMDEEHLTQRLNAYDGVIVICGVEFLKGIFSPSPIAKKMLRSVRIFSQKKGKLLALALPTFPSRGVRNIVEGFAPLFTAIGVDSASSTSSLAQWNNYISKNINQFFSSSFEVKPRPYHTTLHMPCKISDPTKLIGLKTQSMRFNFFPTAVYDYPILLQTQPYGIGWENQKHHNYLMVMKSSMLSFSSIAENFHVCPASFEKRRHMLIGVAAMLQDMKRVITGGSLKVKEEQPVQLFIENGNQFGQGVATKNQNLAMRKTAWMEIPLFFPKTYKANETLEQRKKGDEDQELRQDKLISYILDAGLGTLWVSLTPNIYYSKIAKHSGQEKQFCEGVACFTKKLHDACKQRRVEPPRILVGFEIADNIYAPHLPKNPAIDVYGNVYEDVPSPLEEVFWEQEIKEPLRIFLQKWQNPEISHGLKIGGVVLDLEMYCRKKTGTFLSTMGFEKSVMQNFFAHIGKTIQPKTIHHAIRFLMQEKLTYKYFVFLEQQAKKLGESLRAFFDELIPEGIIACYTPMIMVDWFYKGLWQSLSSADRHMPLFTFNAEFDAHRAWFERNGIYVYHSSALLLSKIQTKKDFSWVSEILKHHDGIWLNRFSRLVEDYDPKSWIAIEQTPLQDDQKKDFLDYLDKV